MEIIRAADNDTCETSAKELASSEPASRSAVELSIAGEVGRGSGRVCAARFPPSRIPVTTSASAWAARRHGVEGKRLLNWTFIVSHPRYAAAIAETRPQSDNPPQSGSESVAARTWPVHNSDSNAPLQVRLIPLE